jgi:hypothetical protein
VLSRPSPRSSLARKEPPRVRNGISFGRSGAYRNKEAAEREPEKGEKQDCEHGIRAVETFFIGSFGI